MSITGEDTTYSSCTLSIYKEMTVVGKFSAEAINHIVIRTFLNSTNEDGNAIRRLTCGSNSRRFWPMPEDTRKPTEEIANAVVQDFDAQ